MFVVSCSAVVSVLCEYLNKIVEARVVVLKGSNVSERLCHDFCERVS